MENRKEIVKMLCEEAERSGPIEVARCAFGGGVRVSIPFDRMGADASIDELDFSVRATNCLHREGRVTVGDVIDVVASGEISHYRNVGRKTVSEIKSKLLIYGYSKLNDAERAAFWNGIIEQNGIDEKAVLALRDMCERGKIKRAVAEK